MKFYQIIAPIILCIIYTTTIFGSEETRVSTRNHYEEVGHAEIDGKKSKNFRIGISWRSGLIVFANYWSTIKFSWSDLSTFHSVLVPHSGGFISLSDMKKVDMKEGGKKITEAEGLNFLSSMPFDSKLGNRVNRVTEQNCQNFENKKSFKDGLIHNSG